MTAYDKDGVRVLLHFATDHPPGRPDVLVIVVSMLNTAPLLVRNVVLQAAVPKVRGTECIWKLKVDRYCFVIDKHFLLYGFCSSE